MASEIRNSFQASEELWLVFENEGFSLTHFLFKTQPGSQARESPPVVAFNIIQLSILSCFLKLGKHFVQLHLVAGGRAVHFLVAGEAGSAVGWTSHQELCLPALAGSFGMRRVGIDSVKYFPRN